MVTVITDREQIRNLHAKFHKRLDNFLTDRIGCIVGYPSGSFPDTVRYSPKLNIWISVRKHENRFWNGFGIGKPTEGRNNSLNGEINFGYHGARNIAGVFAIDNNKKILVLHSGNIGGGKKGVGKNLFLSKFNGDFVNAVHGVSEIKYCLVGELQSPHFPRQVANFINEIYRVKNIANGETVAVFDFLTDFKYTDEHSGVSVTERNEPLIIVRTHGIVVKALADELRTRGLQVGNDKNRDLFVHQRGQITTLFEIKTSSSTQCLYSAVGQLLLYSIPIGNRVTLIAVLPDKLSKTVTTRFSGLGINLLYYKWDNDEPKFADLDGML